MSLAGDEMSCFHNIMSNTDLEALKSFFGKKEETEITRFSSVNVISADTAAPGS